MCQPILVGLIKKAPIDSKSTPQRFNRSPLNKKAVPQKQTLVFKSSIFKGDVKCRGGYTPRITNMTNGKTLKMYLLLKTVIFQCHVKFWVCISSLNDWHGTTLATQMGRREVFINRPTGWWQYIPKNPGRIFSPSKIEWDRIPTGPSTSS